MKSYTIQPDIRIQLETNAPRVLTCRACNSRQQSVVIRPTDKIIYLSTSLSSRHLQIVTLLQPDFVLPGVIQCYASINKISSKKIYKTATCLYKKVW